MKTSIKIYTRKGESKGFALGEGANIIPQIYVDEYNKGLLIESSPDDYERMINRLNHSKLINMCPAYVRVTKNNSLILEN